METPATTLTRKSDLPMKPTRMILAALLTTAAPGAWAQAPLPEMANNQPVNATPSTYPETNTLGTLPYSSQANYNMMEAISVPQTQDIVKPSSPGYIGVLGEKWETDKRGRRSTFIHNGQEIADGYQLPKNELERKTQIMLPGLPFSVPDSLPGKKSHFP